MNWINIDQNKILYLNFNQDASCFCVGTEEGFLIFSVHPFKLLVNRPMGGGIGRIEMLKSTNILALVGGGMKPIYPPTKIIIWDDKIHKVISELRFNSPILNTKIKMDRIIGVTERKIYVFNINTLDCLDIFDSFENTNGIMAISSGDLISVMGFPFGEKGQVKVVNFNSLAPLPLISAHESRIACLCINHNGTLLATASDKGTLIRVFSIQTGELIAELRRGVKNCNISCIAFDEHNKFVGCSGDTGTIHLFSIVTAMKNSANNTSNFSEDEPHNTRSFFGKISGMLGVKNALLDSEYSFAKFRIAEHKNILAFTSVNNIAVLTNEGKFYLAGFEFGKEECNKKEEHSII